MSIENPYAINRGWKIDPDGRQDRKPGIVTTRSMNEEEIKKYGKAEVENMRELLDLDINRMLEICREHGTGIKGAKQIAKEFRLTDKQATNQIYNRGIKKMLQEEKEAEQADINSHEEHVEDTLCTEDPALDEAMKKVAHSIAHEVDLMMEMVPEDNINHPKHYNTGSIEVIDYLQDKLPTDMFEGFCVGNALKYLSRYRFKGGIEDLKKAQWYLSRIIGVMESAS